MAGHFVLWKISSEDKKAMEAYEGSTWGDLQHGDVGWTDGSRAILEGARNNDPPENRDGLPPHRYLELGPDALMSLVKRTLLFSQGWTHDLVRPGLGLRNLCPLAQGAWAQGKKTDALIAQIEHGSTSIEIYYVGKKEMS